MNIGSQESVDKHLAELARRGGWSCTRRSSAGSNRRIGVILLLTGSDARCFAPPIAP